MNNGSAIARLTGVFTVCLLLLGYNVYGGLFKSTGGGIAAADTLSLSSAAESTATAEKTESLGESTPESTAENASSAESRAEEQSVPTAASGTVKGKIISNYISPYKAASSYGNIYLKNSSGLNIDLKQLAESPLKFKIEKSEAPQVLIMHTHTTETYMTENTDYYTDAFSSRTRDKAKNMVSIGDIVATKLNAAGIKTLHDATEHDYPQYTGSSTRAAPCSPAYRRRRPPPCSDA